MGVFKSERRIWTGVTDLEPVAQHLAAHFQAKGYEVMHQRTAAGAWDIDITRSGVFRTISGMRTALKVRIEPGVGSVLARAGIGILGQQALPTVVSMVVFWPILVTQVWGAVQASKTDDEALRVIEEALALAEVGAGGAAGVAGVATGAGAAPDLGSGVGLAAATGAPVGGGVCGSCGAGHSGGKFCTNCGAPLPG